MDEDLLTQSYFLMNIHGQIESAAFPGESFDNVYCKCLFRHGPDWALVNEEDNFNKNNNKKNVANKKSDNNCLFVSQVATKSQDERQIFVWNLPVEATFRSTNVFGWPQIVVSVYGIDSLGNDVIRGYGWSHIPTCPGKHTLRIRLFSPQATTLLNRVTSWFVESRRPEFVDSRLAAGNDGRSLISVVNSGEVVLLVYILLKDFKKYGFLSR